MKNTKTRKPILSGLRVLDIAHQYSAANACAILADLGAEVIAVEHPAGGPVRTMLPRRNGQSMWWKVSARGKKYLSLNLSTPRGREILLSMVKDFDVLVENFRPGTLEKWGLGPEDLEKAGANLTMMRISGYGQTGPYSERPGFGTAAESMSGFANMNGYADGPPTFPSTTLADGVASLWGVIGTLAGLLGNLRQGTVEGVEVVDVALFEGLFRIIPVQIPAYQQTGEVQRRSGNFIPDHGVLRNVYLSRDSKYFIIACVGPVPIRRAVLAAGAMEEVQAVDDGIMEQHDVEKLKAFLHRANDRIIAWAGAHDFAELEKALIRESVVYSTIYDAPAILDDPQYQFREDIITLNDPDLGELKMQGIVPKFPGRDHQVSHAGGAIGCDNEEYFAKLGISAADIAELKKTGVM